MYQWEADFLHKAAPFKRNFWSNYIGFNETKERHCNRMMMVTLYAIVLGKFQFRCLILELRNKIHQEPWSTWNSIEFSKFEGKSFSKCVVWMRRNQPNSITLNFDLALRLTTIPCSCQSAIPRPEQQCLTPKLLNNRSCIALLNKTFNWLMLSCTLYTGNRR